MAIAYQITYELEDDSGERATFGINIPTTFSLAQYTEFGRAVASLVDPIVSGRISNCGLTISVDLSGLTSNAFTSTSDVEEVAAFQFSTVDGTKTLVNVPAIDELAVASGTDDLDQADVFVAAFITAMESGVAVTGGTVSPCDVAESDINSTVYARENFRASGKRR